jgi:hypothetical protein
MWAVDDVKATITGIGGQYGYGFSIFDTRGPGPRVLLSLSYKTQEEATAAGALVTQAVGKAIDIM